ncbi:MAG TPA: hypothetical protein VFV38_32820 [Ktedonobacteraceae bacterium]|nr:hypothetical protein [Ktedonobacteraceae bacterium]
MPSRLPWIIVASHVIVKPGDAIRLLAGKADTGGQGAVTVAAGAVGAVELGADQDTTAIQHDDLAAQSIVAKVGEGAVDRDSFFAKLEILVRSVSPILPHFPARR